MNYMCKLTLLTVAFRHRSGAAAVSASNSPSKQQSSGANRSTSKTITTHNGPTYVSFSCYHMHASQWPASDVRVWHKTLLLALDELGATQQVIS